MVDKVHKIREEVERLMYGYNLEADVASCEDAETEKLANIKYQLCKKILDYIDKVQEEPVSEDLEKAANEWDAKASFTPFYMALDKNGNPYEVRQDYTTHAKSFKAGANWQKAKGESVAKDLSEYINELSKQFPEVSFAKLSRIAVRVAKWQKENLWKPADGNYLPEIDMEVIALLDNGKVVFAHRPNPEGLDAKSIITEKVEHYTPKTYDKGGWNIPNIKYWLDCLMPKEIEL